MQLFCCRWPACGETADGVRRIGFAPDGEDDAFAQLRYLCIANNHKLLVGGRVDEELNTFLLEYLSLVGEDDSAVNIIVGRFDEFG